MAHLIPRRPDRHRRDHHGCSADRSCREGAPRGGADAPVHPAAARTPGPAAGEGDPADAGVESYRIEEALGPPTHRCTPTMRSRRPTGCPSRWRPVSTPADRDREFTRRAPDQRWEIRSAPMLEVPSHVWDHPDAVAVSRGRPKHRRQNTHLHESDLRRGIAEVVKEEVEPRHDRRWLSGWTGVAGSTEAHCISSVRLPASPPSGRHGGPRTRRSSPPFVLHEAEKKAPRSATSCRRRAKASSTTVGMPASRKASRAGGGGGSGAGGGTSHRHPRSRISAVVEPRRSCGGPGRPAQGRFIAFVNYYRKGTASQGYSSAEVVETRTVHLLIA